MIAHLQHEPVSTSLGLSRWEDWVASGWPSPWTSAPPTQIHQYRARKVRSFGKGKCIGSGQDMCVMGLGVLCCRGLWALAPPALGKLSLLLQFLAKTEHRNAQGDSSPAQSPGGTGTKPEGSEGYPGINHPSHQTALTCLLHQQASSLQTHLQQMGGAG